MVWLSVVLTVAMVLFVVGLILSAWIMMEGEGDPWIMLIFVASMFLFLAVFKSMAYLSQVGVY